MMSWNLNDIEQRYCARCHRFLDGPVQLHNLGDEALD
jgi:hypothetical protein